MINVMGSVTAATTVDAPDAVEITDAQFCPAGAALRFGVGNSLARVFGNFTAMRKKDSSKAASAVNVRFLNSETGCEFQVHRKFLGFILAG
jgi:hypothetical protein